MRFAMRTGYEVNMKLSAEELQALRVLEEGLWRGEIRFDEERMEEVLAPDFFEFGRSGRIYSREDTLGIPRQEIPATLPLVDFKARLLSDNVAQVTYTSIVHYEHGEERALRSSIWFRTDSGWKLRFHQGTAVPIVP